MIKRTICIENPCHLKFRNNQLVASYDYVKGYEDRAEKTIPIEDLGMIVLEHQQITVSHYLLDKDSCCRLKVIPYKANALRHRLKQRNH